MNKIKNLHIDFSRALERLKEAIKEDVKDRGGIVVDATIQRFEFTFELAWKLARAALAHEGIDADMPRLVIKEAFRAKLIHDGEAWIDMLEDRNKSSHIYDEEQAFKIYSKIKASHFKLMEDFEKTFQGNS